jgi:hypothetical protein
VKNTNKPGNALPQKHELGNGLLFLRSISMSVELIIPYTILKMQGVMNSYSEAKDKTCVSFIIIVVLKSRSLLIILKPST